MWWFRTAGQIVLLSLIAVAGDMFCDWLNLPLPGALLGMVALYIFLVLGWVKLSWFEDGSDFLIRELLLFFITAAVGIVRHTELFGKLGSLLVAAVIISIAILLWVVSVTTLIVMKSKRKGRRYL